MPSTAAGLRIDKDGEMGTRPFERIFAAGTEAARSGSLRIEGDPHTTGRWGPSIILRPRGAMRQRLGELTRTAVGITGDDHWQSGADGRAHLTVRALEPYTESIDPKRLDRYKTALHTALGTIGSFRFEFRYLGLSPGSLMVGAIPQDSFAQNLRDRLGPALGSDGWLEDKYYENGRDPIWYCSLLHYIRPVTQVDALLDWIAGHADTTWGDCEITSVDLCTWHFDGDGMAPEPAVSLPAPRNAFQAASD